MLWYGRDDGLTETANLAPACGRCHHLVHRGKIIITGNADEPDGLTFTDEHGRTLIRYPVPTPPTGPPPEPAEPFRHPTGERFDTRWLWFKPPPPPKAA